MGWGQMWVNFVNAGKVAFGSMAGIPDLFGLALLAVILLAERNMGVAPEVMLFSVFILIPLLTLADLLSPIFMWLEIIIVAFLAVLGLLKVVG